MSSFTTQTIISLLPFLVTSVSAHGYITNPVARQPSTQFGALCGSQTLSNQASDIYGNIQGELQVAGSGLTADCNLWLCKGFVFADQPASNVQSYTAGEVVPIHFDIRAPHDGVANVSIVDTASNSVISELKSFAQFALTSRPIQSTETDFDITIPSDLGGKCTTAGECVIQMFWDARSIDQTYESCVDFVVGGSGAGSGSGSGSSSSSVAASVSTTAAVSSSSATSSVTSSVGASVSSVVASSTSASVATTSLVTAIGVGNGTKPITSTSNSTKPTTSISITSAPGTSAVPTGDIFTLTAGTVTMKCHEEL